MRMCTARSHDDADTDARDRLWTPAFLRLGLAESAYFCAAGVQIYALPLYVTGPVGSTEAGAGLAFGVFAIASLLLRPTSGHLADRYGRLPLLVGGALLAGVAVAALALAGSLLLVVLARVVAGLAEAAFFVAAFAALADLAPAHRIGEAISYNSLGLYLGLAAGPPLAETLLRAVGFVGAWFGGAALCLAAAALSLGIGETRNPGSSPGRTPWLHVASVPPALGFLASVVPMGAFLAFASLHAEQVGVSSTSLPLLVYGSVAVAGRIALARVEDRLPSLPLGAAALAVLGAGLGVIALAPTRAGLLAGAVVLALGVTVSTPAFFAAILATAAASRRGAASATASIALDLGLGLGPILLGWVAVGSGIPAAFALGAAVAFAGSCWTLWLSVRRAGQQSPGAPDDVTSHS